MYPVITGVDPSSRKLAIVTTFGDDTLEPEMLTIDLPQDHTEGCGLAFRLFFEYISGLKERTGHTPFVFLERPLMGKFNPLATIVQCFVSGAVQSACCEALVPVILVQNKSWKKNVVGNGNATKPQIAMWVQDNWAEVYDLAGKDQDLLDAAGINRHGKMMEDRPKRKVIIRRPRLKAVA